MFNVAEQLVAYAHFGFSWWLFAALILFPDLGFFAYLRGPRFGARIYNLLHTYSLPLALGLAAFGLQTLGSSSGEPSVLGLDARLGFALALIWISHIGLDRAIGYGLKLSSGFHDTHLGRKGPQKG